MSGRGPRIARILCPTDFSDFSRNALEHALVIASAFGAGITAIHVMPQTLMQPELFPYIKEPILVPPEIRDRAQARLDQLETDVEPGEVPFEAVLESGDAAHRILSCAESLPADLLVVGTRGRGGLERLVLGSVTERLLWNARTPTLVVERPPRRGQPVGFPYETILVVNDASGGADEAQEWAVSFCKRARGSLILVQVPGGEAARSGLARKALEHCAVEVAGVDPAVPEKGIRRLAAEREAHLIIFGNYSPTARELIRYGERPVLVVGHRLPEESEEES